MDIFTNGILPWSAATVIYFRYFRNAGPVEWPEWGLTRRFGSSRGGYTFAKDSPTVLKLILSGVVIRTLSPIDSPGEWRFPVRKGYLRFFGLKNRGMFQRCWASLSRVRYSLPWGRWESGITKSWSVLCSPVSRWGTFWTTSTSSPTIRRVRRGSVTSEIFRPLHVSFRCSAAHEEFSRWWLAVPLLSLAQFTRNPKSLKDFMSMVRKGLGPTSFLVTTYSSLMELAYGTVSLYFTFPQGRNPPRFLFVGRRTSFPKLSGPASWPPSSSPSSFSDRTTRRSPTWSSGRTGKSRAQPGTETWTFLPSLDL
jgi:hypothetical protein